MFSKYGLFCILLSFILMGLVFKNYEIWSPPSRGVTKKEPAKKAEGKMETPQAIGGSKEDTPREDYHIIGEKNIFNPDRKEFTISTAEQMKPLARPQIILYGVLISENYATASVINPGRPLRKGEREIKGVKIGDQIGEYKVANILPDRITMEAAGDSFEVLLYDPRAPKRRIEIRTPAKPAEMTSTQPVPTPVPMTPSPPSPQISPVPPMATPVAPSPVRERVIEPPVPRPVSPGPAADPGLWRGRRSPLSGLPGEVGTK